MKRIKKHFNHKPHVVLSVPTLLFFLTFIINLISALKDGKIDSSELQLLLSTASGFETVVLIIIMFILKGYKK